MTHISVILCTYNRCESLAKALESVALSQLPDDLSWEVLVIDNNSRDKTREVVEGFCFSYPDRFRYVFEPKQGKSNALNTGIREARGAILAFMDDDVLVESSWLYCLAQPLLRSDLSGTGGRILSQQVVSAPSWLALDGQYSLGGMLALFDKGDEPKELDSPPFGTNMAFRKEIFARYGGFRTDMGPCPGSEIRNEDTEFGRRLLAAGEHLWYVPTAVVYHAVPEERLRQSYLLRFWYDHGRAEIRESGRRPDVLGIPRYFLTIPKIALTVLPRRAFRWIASADPKRRFFYKGMVWMTFGQMAEMPRLWSSKIPSPHVPGLHPVDSSENAR